MSTHILDLELQLMLRPPLSTLWPNVSLLVYSERASFVLERTNLESEMLKEVCGAIGLCGFGP